MPKKSANAVLWENIANAMIHHWHEINLYKLAKDAKIGTGGAARLKAQRSATRLSTIVKVAALWKLEPWQLLMPGFDPAKPPVAVLSEEQQKLYEQLKKAQKAFHSVESSA
jgi:hypothetical protein